MFTEKADPDQGSHTHTQMRIRDKLGVTFYTVGCPVRSKVNAHTHTVGVAITVTLTQDDLSKGCLL